jgi:hypothetical protein
MHQCTAPASEVSEDSLARRVLSHWHRVFNTILVEDEPTQHFYCDYIWPTDVYGQMLRLLPAPELYTPLNLKEWVNAQGVSTRDRCFLPEVLVCLDSERASFWRQMWLAFTANSFKRLIFSKFRKDIGLRLGLPQENVEDSEVFVSCSILRDIEDYRIGPHPDGWPGIVTMQFYLPADASQEDLGTSFYRELPWSQRPIRGRYEEIRRMPFKPNSGYAFVVNDLPSRRSLHGRELIRSGAGVRNTVLIRWMAEDSTHKRGHQGFSKTHNGL